MSLIDLSFGLYLLQSDCELVKIDIHCHVQGDVVLECISLDSDVEREQMMFRVMFNTAFIRSNILMLNRDEIDILWNTKDHFPKTFRVEVSVYLSPSLSLFLYTMVCDNAYLIKYMPCFWLKVLFSDMEASSSSVISVDLPRIEEKEGLPVEAFAKVKEIFSNVEWLDSKTDVANVLQQITASNMLLERLDSGASASTSTLLNESLSGRLKFDSKSQSQTNSPKSSVHEERSVSPLQLSEDVPMDKMIKPVKIEELSAEKIKTPASLGPASKPILSFDLSKDSDSTKKETESSEPKKSLENDPEFPASTAQVKQSIPLIEPSIDADSMKMKTGSLESDKKNIESFASKNMESLASKAVLENNTMFPASESNTNAISMKNIGLLRSKVKEIESLFSEALLEKDRIVKFEPKTLLEVDTNSPRSAGQEKLSVSSFESIGDAAMEKKKEALRLTASPENNIKTPAPTDSSPTEMKIESLELKGPVENDTKFPMSPAQTKQSIPLTEPSTKANSLEKMEKLESKEKDIELLESKSLLENDTKKEQSVPLIQTSKDASSLKTVTEKSESTVLSETDIRSPTSKVDNKQISPLIEPSIDAKSIKKKIDPQQLQVSLQLPTQSKIISPRTHQAIRPASTSASYSPTSLLGSPVAISRYQNSPSALGITTVLQDHTPMDIKEEVTHAASVSPRSDSKVPKSVEPCSTSIPTTSSSPELLPSSPLKSSDPKVPKSVELCSTSIPTTSSSLELLPSLPLKSSDSKVSKSVELCSTSIPTTSSSPEFLPSSPLKSSDSKALKSVEPCSTSIPTASSPPEFLPSLPLKSSDSKALKSVELCSTSIPTTSSPPELLPSSPLKTLDSKALKSVEPCSTSIPTTLSPELLSSSPLKSSSVDPLAAMEKTFKPIIPIPPPPPPPQQSENSMHDTNQISSSIPPPPPPPFLPETSFSTVENSLKHPPPHPPPPPPPPPSSTGQTSSSSIPPPLQSMNNSVAMSGPPPPPPPPRQPGTTPGSTSTPLAPPPPPPPGFAIQNSLSKGPANIPPVPPPPSPSANGLSNSAASPQSRAIPGPPGTAPPIPGPPGNVPPIPGPPSGAFGAKGRGLLRTNAKTQTKRSNLKPYHWLKLTRAMHGSLWAETQKLDEASRYELVCVKTFVTEVIKSELM